MTVSKQVVKYWLMFCFISYFFQAFQICKLTITKWHLLSPGTNPLQLICGVSKILQTENFSENATEDVIAYYILQLVVWTCPMTYNSFLIFCGHLYFLIFLVVVLSCVLFSVQWNAILIEQSYPDWFHR